jgi:16S rRNA (uracil1498-N3)-methyltransferase
MDMIVQKATELGAHRIVPVMCQRSVPNPTAQRAERRVARWQQISIEASKQSRRPFFPVISEILNLGKVLEDFYADLKLIFVPDNLSASPENLKYVLGQNTGSKEIIIFIGPEGGFTENEVHQAISVGAIPVLLGSNILRTETAAIAALAIVLYEGDAGYSEQDT